MQVHTMALLNVLLNKAARAHEAELAAYAKSVALRQRTPGFVETVTMTAYPGPDGRQPAALPRRSFLGNLRWGW